MDSSTNSQLDPRWRSHVRPVPGFLHAEEGAPSHHASSDGWRTEPQVQRQAFRLEKRTVIGILLGLALLVVFVYFAVAILEKAQRPIVPEVVANSPMMMAPGQGPMGQPMMQFQGQQAASQPMVQPQMMPQAQPQYPQSQYNGQGMMQAPVYPAQPQYGAYPPSQMQAQPPLMSPPAMPSQAAPVGLTKQEAFTNYPQIQRLNANYGPIKKSTDFIDQKPSFEAKRAWAGSSPLPQQTEQYVIQVGSYMKPEEAYRLAGQLMNVGYQARVSQEWRSDRTVWYHVHLGNYTQKEQANADAMAFSTHENWPAMVVRTSA